MKQVMKQTKSGGLQNGSAGTVPERAKRPEVERYMILLGHRRDRCLIPG
jgi:hypothetical protein